jgi:hypothetical protein
MGTSLGRDRLSLNRNFATSRLQEALNNVRRCYRTKKNTNLEKNGTPNRKRLDGMAAFVASAVFKLAVIMEKSFTSSVVDVPLEVVRREMNSTICQGRVSFAGFTKWKIIDALCSQECHRL